MKQTAFSQKFSLNMPLIQAPMAGVATAELASTVCNAGAIGSIVLGTGSIENSHAQVKELKQKTNKAFNLNFFCHRQVEVTKDCEQAWLKKLAPHFEHFGENAPPSLNEIYPSFYNNDVLLKLVLDEAPAIASFHFGFPTESAIKAMKQKGIYLLASATNLNDAKRLEAAGFDGVIAQGFEAGGHRGMFDENMPDDQISLTALLQQCIKNLKIPVIAAGGLMNGAAIKAVLDMGAIAAQMGTAFINCTETLADIHYRKLLSSEAAFHTVISRAFSGRPARALPNRFTEITNGVKNSEVPPYPFAYDLAKKLHAVAKAHSNGGFGACWAGQGAPLIRSTMSAKTLVEQIIDEFNEANEL